MDIERIINWLSWFKFLIRSHIPGYRELCARMHSSVLSAAMGLIPVIDPNKSSHEIDSGFVEGYLPFATLMVWGLAIQLASRLQLPVAEQLADIARIFEHWCKIDGQGAWSLR